LLASNALFSAIIIFVAAEEEDSATADDAGVAVIVATFVVLDVDVCRCYLLILLHAS
jgi:hypothetical protein